MTRTDARRIAQDIIIGHGPSNACEFTHDLLVQQTGRQPSGDEYALVREQVIKQGNRVRAMFGYETAG